MTPHVMSFLIIVFVVGGSAEADFAESACRERAVSAVVALGGRGENAVGRRAGPVAFSFTVDGEWQVSINKRTGYLFSLWNIPAESNPENLQPLPEGVTDDDIKARALELIRAVHPDFDLFEHEFNHVLREKSSSWVEAQWRQVSPDTGFPTNGRSHVSFGWRGGPPRRMRAFDYEVPDWWRRPVVVPEEEACRLAEEAVGGKISVPEGKSAAYVAKKSCSTLGEEPGFENTHPVWKVVAYEAGTDGPGIGETYGVVFVDPWTGEVFGIEDVNRWAGGGGGGGGGQDPAASDLSLEQLDPPLRTVIGFVMLALGLVGAVVLLRSRKASE